MHRPTFFPAIAKNRAFEHPTALVGRRQLHGNQTLKQRQPGQGTSDELRTRDLRQELEDREFVHKKGKTRIEELVETPLLTDKDNEQTLKLDGKLYNDKDLEEFDDEDADADAGNKTNDEEDYSESDDDSDDSDDEEALMAEYMKIKQEREEERIKKEKEEKEALEKAALQQALESNPLLKSKSSQVKRRWDQDVVFRNQARSEPEAKKRFINDTIRNDFHRRFLNKFIQ